MRICFAYDAAYPWMKGGIELRRFLIMKKLVEAGNEVHLFTMFREGMVSDEFEYEGIKHHCVAKALPTKEMYKHGRRNMTWPIKYALALFPRVLGYRFDLIDAEAFPFLHMVPLVIYAWLTGTKLVVTWAEVWSLDYWIKYLGVLGIFGFAMERLCSHATRRMIAISWQTRDGLVDVLRVPRENITVFPAALSGDEIRAFLEKHRCRKSKSFIAIGRLIPEKRIDLAIRAISKVDVQLVVVGVGPEKQRLVDTAKGLKVSDRVEFLENIEREELFNLVCTSMGLLVFSEREGLSVVSLEALVLGTPVIIVNSTSLPPEIRKFCYSMDENELSASMNMLIKNRNSVLYKPRIPADLIMREFSADRSEEVYKRLLNK